MSVFQPVIYVLMEIVRHHKVFNEFCVCPHAPNKIKEGNKRSNSKKAKVCFYLLFCKIIKLQK